MSMLVVLVIKSGIQENKQENKSGFLSVLTISPSNTHVLNGYHLRDKTEAGSIFLLRQGWNVCKYCSQRFFVLVCLPSFN